MSQHEKEITSLSCRPKDESMPPSGAVFPLTHSQKKYPHQVRLWDTLVNITTVCTHAMQPIWTSLRMSCILKRWGQNQPGRSVYRLYSANYLTESPRHVQLSLDKAQQGCGCWSFYCITWMPCNDPIIRKRFQMQGAEKYRCDWLHLDKTWFFCTWLFKCKQGPSSPSLFLNV